MWQHAREQKERIDKPFGPWKERYVNTYLAEKKVAYVGNYLHILHSYASYSNQISISLMPC